MDLARIAYVDVLENWARKRKCCNYKPEKNQKTKYLYFRKKFYQQFFFKTKN